MTPIDRMMKIAVNNDQCVILEFKPGITMMDKIASGIFNGNETMIRVTKGRDHECRIFKTDGGSWAWHWGYSGHTLVSSSVYDMQKMIEHFIGANGIDIGW